VNLEPGNFQAFWSVLKPQALLVMPEIILAVAMCAVVLVPFFKRDSRLAPVVTGLIGLGLALLATLTTFGSIGEGGGYFLFGPDLANTQTVGMLSIDMFSQTFKVMLLLFTMLVVVQWLINRPEETHTYDIPDFMCLLLGATFGMSLMSSANNLLAIFVATEAASLPSFALAGFRKHTNEGTEGSLKYVLFGAASSAIGVYGMSLIYGMTGSLDLATVGVAASTDLSPLLAVGIAGMLLGIAFKLSAVPVHFWCPDVFQGASFEVTTFLSVASKGAAVAMLCRVLMSFSAVADAATAPMGLLVGVAIAGAVTASWGNLVALHQTNIKRLLAFSSIAHAGYMILGASVIAMAIPAGGPDGLTQSVVTNAILFYIFVYMFMNLGAFTVGAIIARQSGSEDIRDYSGMLRRSPLLAIVMSVFLLSLFGFPGLGGFVGKVYLMSAMAKLGLGGMFMMAALLINTVISLYYYMRPVIYMTVKPDEEDRPVIHVQPAAAALLVVLAAALLWTGLIPGSAASLVSEDREMKQPLPAAAAAAVEPVDTVVASPTTDKAEESGHGS